MTCSLFIYYFNHCRVVFVNNFAFGPSVDHKLKERFASMREGMYQQLLIFKMFVWYFKCKKKNKIAIVINKPREMDQNIIFCCFF